VGLLGAVPPVRRALAHEDHAPVEPIFVEPVFSVPQGKGVDVRLVKEVADLEPGTGSGALARGLVVEDVEEVGGEERVHVDFPRLHDRIITLEPRDIVP
jgi:hypothetical protein